MKKLKKLIMYTTAIVLSGCSVFGHSGVDIAPYTVLEKEGEFELRQYEKLILVTTSMAGLPNQRSPFYKLFNYISGNNKTEQEISMTAPVFMKQNETSSENMAFVLPDNFDYENAPTPNDPSVKLEQLINYTVATITFNGHLRRDNIQQHRQKLEQWIAKKQYKNLGNVHSAGYNPPYTLPSARRNEVLIQVER